MDRKTTGVKAAIMQPTYLPWLGYFDIVDQVDKFVFLDDVQLVKRSWQTRNRIKTAQGELFLTIPIKKATKRDDTLICNAVISEDEPWKERHVRSIELAYKKAPYFDLTFPFIKKIIFNEEKKLSDYNIYIIKQIAAKLGLRTDFICSSELKGISGKKDARLVSICKYIGCDEYVAVQGSAAYIEKESPGGNFTKNNLKFLYHNYEHPAYDQINGNFISFMSVVDLFFNHGFDAGLAIIKNGRRSGIDPATFRQEHLNLVS
ncbi:MAG TPA: hypothetical protein DCY56_04655 [Candidatus Omnitrophica bacterium]|nr:hypothetical protein [Candidatus Omnitrophota bacterium]